MVLGASMSVMRRRDHESSHGRVERIAHFMRTNMVAELATKSGWSTIRLGYSMDSADSVRRWRARCGYDQSRCGYGTVRISEDEGGEAARGGFIVSWSLSNSG